jgi:hypothetical protein
VVAVKKSLKDPEDAILCNAYAVIPSAIRVGNIDHRHKGMNVWLLEI